MTYKLTIGTRARTALITALAVIGIASPFAWTHSQELKVTATCYSFNEPNNITATGKRVSTKYIAVSRDVEKLFPMHTKIVLTCGVNKIYATVEDRMHRKWTRRVDIFKTSKKACNVWGIKRGCKIERVK